MLEQIAPGLWRGRIEQEDGEWLVGDNLPEGHPGLLHKNDPRGLRVKFWKASSNAKSQKYVGEGWTPPLPAHGGRLEGVQVMRGDFGVEVGNAVFSLVPGSKVEFPPDVSRRWFLPRFSQEAWGTTVCKFTPPKSRYGPGSCFGEGYEYHSIFPGQKILSTLLAVPYTLRDWCFQLVMVFDGRMPFGELGAYVESGWYLFRSPATEIEFESERLGGSLPSNSCALATAYY